MTEIYVSTDDLPIMLEIAGDPDDCFLNHKTSKSQLRRLMTEGLIEVETRRISAWSKSQPQGPPGLGVYNTPEYKEWSTYLRSRTWQDRTEIHAHLTETGKEWHRHYLETVTRTEP